MNTNKQYRRTPDKMMEELLYEANFMSERVYKEVKEFTTKASEQGQFAYTLSWLKNLVVDEQFTIQLRSIIANFDIQLTGNNPLTLPDFLEDSRTNMMVDIVQSHRGSSCSTNQYYNIVEHDKHKGICKTIELLNRILSERQETLNQPLLPNS